MDCIVEGEGFDAGIRIKFINNDHYIIYRMGRGIKLIWGRRLMSHIFIYNAVNIFSSMINSVQKINKINVKILDNNFHIVVCFYCIILE